MKGQLLDLKKTINLPKTAFPMKANLPQNEPKTLERWEQMKIYDRIRQTENMVGHKLGEFSFTRTFKGHSMKAATEVAAKPAGIPEGAIEQTLAAELTGPPCGDLSNHPRCVASPPLFRHRSRARTR